MLELAYIRENKEAVISALNKRCKNFTEEAIERLIVLDKNSRTVKKSLDDLLGELNKSSSEVGELIKKGKNNEATKLRENILALKKQISTMEEELKDINEKMQEIVFNLPNTPHELVKKGKDAEDNEVVFTHDINKLEPKALYHWDLCEKLDIIDFKAGAKITGSGFPVFKGKGAKLQRALINYFLDKNVAGGYTEIVPPYVVNEDSAFGTGQLPDKEGQMYRINEDNLYLIPTSEVPVTNIYRDIILKEEDFPIKMTSYSPCFRREAGSYGKDVKGLNRLHQFDKVEIVQIEHPNKSWETLENMVAHVRGLLEELGLPFRILRLCGGDMGFASAMTYDFEVYSIAQKRWLEVSSVSNFSTFQANRLKLRYKSKEDGKNRLCHTLNGSAIALPRILASMIENYQTPDGKIKIPKVLINYTGFDEIS